MEITEELKNAAKFNVNTVYVEGKRKSGYDNINFPCMFLDFLKKEDVNWNEITILDLDLYLPYDDLYTSKNFVESWKKACTISKICNVKVMYTIGCTSFLVFPDSPIDMLENLDEKPSFYKNVKNVLKDPISNLDYESVFKNNGDILEYMRYCNVGPYTMPRMTKKYFEYMIFQHEYEDSIKECMNRMEWLYGEIAKRRCDEYLSIAKNDNSIIHDNSLAGFSLCNRYMASQIWKLIHIIYNSNKFNNRIHWSEDSFDVGQDELNFIFKYVICPKTHSLLIDSILTALIDIANKRNMIPDPIVVLKKKKVWEDPVAMKEISKKMVNLI